MKYNDLKQTRIVIKITFNNFYKKTSAVIADAVTLVFSTHGKDDCSFSAKTPSNALERSRIG